MAIDLTKEQLFTLTQATKYLPSINGKRIAISTLWRWCRKGLRGVHLDYVRIGRRIFTSPDALSQFANALAKVDMQEHDSTERAISWGRPKRPRSEAQRRKDIEAAERELREAGI